MSLVCQRCGSEDVEATETRWINPNTGKEVEGSDPPPGWDLAYCNACGDEVDLEDVDWRVTIAWGSEQFRADEPNAPEVFHFASRDLLDAFMEGVESASGYLDHKALYDTREGFE